MSIEEFLARLRSGQPVSFAETLAVIAEHYLYRPTRFRNGLGADALVNDAGRNERSCRVFYFAQLQNLTEQETLALFGDCYRRDVLQDPEGNSHPNIRRFLRDGWAGIQYEAEALLERRKD